MTLSLRRRFHSFLDLLFPPLCAFCSKLPRAALREHLICEACLSSAHRHDAFFCIACRSRLANTQKLCHRTEPIILFPATEYADARIASLIWRLKYRNEPALARPLGFLLARSFAAVEDQCRGALILPVPLHPRRLRERGFNQAERIAHWFSRAATRELSPPCLERIRDTKTQRELSSRKEREENLRGAFRVSNPSAICGKTFLLIDDVCTSGFTLRAAARSLKDAGAAKIIGAVVAKV